MAIHTWQKVENFDYLFRAQHTWGFTPGFCRTNRFYCRTYVKIHYCKKLLWAWIFGKILIKWDAKESDFSSYYIFWYTYWKCCSITFIVFWVFPMYTALYVFHIMKRKGYSSIRLLLNGIQPQWCLQWFCLSGRVLCWHNTTVSIF